MCFGTLILEVANSKGLSCISKPKPKSQYTSRNSVGEKNISILGDMFEVWVKWGFVPREFKRSRLWSWELRHCLSPVESVCLLRGRNWIVINLNWLGNNWCFPALRNEGKCGQILPDMISTSRVVWSKMASFCSYPCLIRTDSKDFFAHTIRNNLQDNPIPIKQGVLLVETFFHLTICGRTRPNNLPRLFCGGFYILDMKKSGRTIYLQDKIKD